ISTGRASASRSPSATTARGCRRSGRTGRTGRPGLRCAARRKRAASDLRHAGDMSLPTPADVTAAAARIHRYVRRTPILRAEVDGRPLVLKLEHLQQTGSFKLRGATNALLAGPRPDRVVTASGGNHGLAVATAAARLGIPVVVHVPSFTPELKRRRMIEAGANLITHEVMDDVLTAAAEDGAQPGSRYLH